MFSYGPGMLLVVLSWPLFVESAVYRTTRHPAGLLLNAGACGVEAPLVKSYHRAPLSTGSSSGSVGHVFEADSSSSEAMPSGYPDDTDHLGLSSTSSDSASFKPPESSATVMTWPSTFTMKAEMDRFEVEWTASRCLLSPTDHRLRAKGRPRHRRDLARSWGGCHVQLRSWHAPRGPFVAFIRRICGVSDDETSCWTLAQCWSMRF